MKKFLILFIGCVLVQGSVNAVRYQHIFTSKRNEAEIVAALKPLLASRNDIDQKVDEDGWLPLNFAAAHGFKSVVQFLIDAGADVNKPNGYGRTPFLLAAYAGRIDIVLALIAAKADVKQPDCFGSTPLHLATICKHQEIVEIIKNHLAHKEMLPLLCAFHPRLGAQSGLKDFVPQWMLPQIFELLKKADR